MYYGAIRRECKMKIKLNSRYIKDSATGLDRFVAGLHCETRTRIWDYNEIEGMQMFGKTPEISDFDRQVADTIMAIYARNAKLFAKLNHAFDDQIARETFAKLYEIFRDGIEIEVLE